MEEQTHFSSQEPEIAGFIAKTYQILFSQEFSKIIFWSQTGREFVIKDVNKFEEIVLPRFFRHKKFNSFVRQLNMYGFHKSRRDTTKSVFSHSHFQKERTDLLKEIKRKNKIKKVTGTEDLKVLSEDDADEPQKPQEVTPTKKIKTQVGLPELAEEGQNQKVNLDIDLNVSFKKISLSDLGNVELLVIENDHSVSLEEQLIDESSKNEEQEVKMLMNPSCFFSSFTEKK